MESKSEKSELQKQLESNSKTKALLESNDSGLRNAAKNLLKSMEEFWKETKNEAKGMTYREVKELELADKINKQEKNPSPDTEYTEESLIETFNIPKEEKVYAKRLLPMHVEFMKYFMKKSGEDIQEMLKSKSYRVDKQEMEKIEALKKKIKDASAKLLKDVSGLNLTDLKEAKEHFDKDFATGNIHKVLEKHLEEGTWLFDVEIDEEWIGAVIDDAIKNYQEIRKAVEKKLNELEPKLEQKNIADKKPEKPKFTPRPPQTPPPSTAKFVKPKDPAMLDQWKKIEAQAQKQVPTTKSQKPEQPKKPK